MTSSSRAIATPRSAAAMLCAACFLLLLCPVRAVAQEGPRAGAAEPGAPVAAPDTFATTIRLAIKPWPADARVTLNGRALGSGEHVAEVTPGEHEVRVERAGYVPRVEVLRLSAMSVGEVLLRVSLSAEPPAAEAVGRVGGIVDELASPSTLGWVSTAAGVGLITTSVTLAALSGVPRECSVAQPEPCGEARGLSGWSALSGVLGGAALLGGLGLLRWDALAGEPSQLPAGASARRAARLHVSGRGVALTWRFR